MIKVSINYFEEMFEIQTVEDFLKILTKYNNITVPLITDVIEIFKWCSKEETLSIYIYTNDTKRTQLIDVVFTMKIKMIKLKIDLYQHEIYVSPDVWGQITTIHQNIEDAVKTLGY